tara:strand:- start:347 stop:1045 length:699 start_codon:yes stop_codon:yes gene_type:complete
MGGLGPWVGNQIGYQSDTEMLLITGGCLVVTALGYIRGNGLWHYLHEPLFKEDQAREIEKRAVRLIVESMKGGDEFKEETASFTAYMQKLREQRLGSPGIRKLMEFQLAYADVIGRAYRLLDICLQHKEGFGPVGPYQEECTVYLANSREVNRVELTMIPNQEPHCIPGVPRPYERRKLAYEIARDEDAWLLVAGRSSMDDLMKRAKAEAKWFSQDEQLTAASSEDLRTTSD